MRRKCDLPKAKHKIGRISSVTLCLLLLIGLMPAVTFAATAPTIRHISFENGGQSTVYVNEAKSVGGGSDSIKYIYSADIIRHTDVLNGLKSIVPSSHKSLVPAPSNTAGIASSTSGTPTSDWASAKYVAENIIPGKGTVTSSSRTINASSVSMATDLETLKTQLEAQNYAVWQSQEAENEAAWEAQEAENKAAWEAAEQAKKDANSSYEIQPYVPSEYIPSEYVPLDFTGTTFANDPPTLKNNQFTVHVGTFISGPFNKYEDGVIKESYDINLLCHTVTVLSETGDKSIPASSVASDKSAETGDSNNMMLWVGLLLISVIGAFILITCSRKKLIK